MGIVCVECGGILHRIHTYGWQIFAGKGHHVQESGNGATYDIVMNVLRDHNLLDKGHHHIMSIWTIFFLLFYSETCPTTGQELVVRTLRVNRQVLPDTIKQAKPKKGEQPLFVKDSRLQYMVWQDKKKVSLVTSLHDDSTFV